MNEQQAWFYFRLVIDTINVDTDSLFHRATSFKLLVSEMGKLRTFSMPLPKESQSAARSGGVLI
jgi:hypothetical protein